MGGGRVVADEEPGPVIRHSGPPREGKLVAGDGEHIEAISAHIERHVGPVTMVFHEIVSTGVHVDIHQVGATAERPFHVLVTSGMSDLAMSVPEGAEEFRFAELFLTVPAEWSLTMEAFKDEANYWPIRTLKVLARMPHEYDTWLSLGHTVGHGEPPTPYASGTDLCAALLLGPVSVPDEFGEFAMPDGRKVHFWQVFPLYREELDLKVKRGTDALLELFTRHRTPDVIDPKRRNVCRSRFGWW